MKSFSKIVSTHDCLGENVEVIFAPLFNAPDEFAGGHGGSGLADVSGLGIDDYFGVEVSGLEAVDCGFVVVEVEEFGVFIAHLSLFAILGRRSSI
jgi:hypothetical protein